MKISSFFASPREKTVNSSLLIIEAEDKCSLIMQHLPPRFALSLGSAFNQAIRIFNGFCVERERRF
jgi:hypothetical protein